MNKQTILWVAFAGMVILQLWLPAQSAIQYEQTLRQGEAFKFETALVDPNDPFRGKYITLNFPRLDFAIEQSSNQVQLQELSGGETVYCMLAVDERGYAEITDVRVDEPAAGETYMPAKVSSGVFRKIGDREHIRLRYPFERFYLEERKAPEAERRYNEAVRDTSQQAYALVKIRKGMAVLEDVVLNGVSVRSLEE